MATPSPKRRKISSKKAGATEEHAVDHARSTPSRASFMSPTRASLARFNPSLLPQSGSSSRPPLPSNISEASTSGLPPQEDASGAPVKRQLEREMADAVQREADSRRFTDGSTLLQDIARQAMDFGLYGGSDGLRSDSNAPEIETEPALPAPDVEEDELATPSPGITRTITSAQPKRSRSLGARLSKSPAKTLPSHASVASPLATELPQRSRPEEDVSTALPEDVEVEQTEPIVAPFDPVLRAKQKEQARLLKELESLKNKVQHYEREIRTRTSTDLDQTQSGDIEGLVSLIASNERTATAGQEGSKETPLSQLFKSFLPFASTPARPLSPPTSPHEHLPSHLPVETADQTPSLQLFTPLRCTSTVALAHKLGSANESPALVQQHTMNIFGPKRHFTASLNIRLDAATRSVKRLSILQLSRWSEHELGVWVRQRALRNDVGNVFWAMNTYWELAMKRAQCWIRCEREFPDLVRTSIAGDEIAPSQRKPSRGKHVATDDVDGSDGEHAVGHSGSSADENLDIGNSDLQSHLGRDFLYLQRKETVLRISWKIAFDWTGQAESTVEARAAFPNAWLESDSRKSLVRVPETFDMLVLEKGVHEAISVMTRLLFS